MDPLLEQFLSEARDNLSYLDANLKALEGGDAEEINALFRAAHTLKGGAGLVGFEAVKQITHAAEDLLDALRNQKIEYSETLLNTLYDAFDEVFELVEQAEAAEGIEGLDIDQSRIEALQNEIRGFLSSDASTKSTSAQFEAPFNTVQAISLPCLSPAQAADIAGLVLPPVETIPPAFADEAKPWVIDLDLDTDTLVLGNDPFYLLDLLGDNLKMVHVEVNDCAALAEDPMQWQTRLKIVTESTPAEIEEVFYNLLFELEAAPLHIGCLLLAPEPLDEQVVSTLLAEMEFDADSLRAAAREQEGSCAWLLERMACLLEAGVGEALIRQGLAWLGIELSDKKSASAASTSEKVPEAFDALTEVETGIAKEILLAQQQVLQVDIHAMQHVPGVLCRVAQAMGAPCAALPDTEAAARQLLEQLLSQLGEPAPGVQTASVPESAPARPAPAMTESVAADTPPVKPQVSMQKKAAASASSAHAVPKTIKVEQQAIDELMDIVGELLVVKNALPYIAEKIDDDRPRRELLSKYEQLSRMVMQLQDRVMGMRLLPLSYIFSRYPKLVRDIARKLDKKIRYEESGGETKLDKMMIEQLADPMIHIIRNSLDHGLETPEERKAVGKPEEGTLRVSAHSEGDRVFIEISDDGRGIDVNKVINKALEKRLIEPDAIDRMSEEEKLSLIFLPGLSTKDEISDLSGRGVGADAVKTIVESLGGRVIVRSKQGQGTTVLLELPVSVALSSVFHVRMSTQNYAVNMDEIVETEKVLKKDVQTVQHQPVIHLRGEVIPLVVYPELLQRETLKEQECVLILQTEAGKVGFIVDDFIGQLDVVQKPLTGPLAHHPLISGVALLGDGAPLFVLNIQALFSGKNNTT